MKILVVMVLVVVVALGVLRLVSRKLLYFPQPLEPGRPAALKQMEKMANQDTARIALRSLKIKAEDGIFLEGWILEKDVNTLPFVFYFGGNAEEVSLNAEDFMEEVAANVVLVNYRGYGQSQGRPTEDGLKADCLALFDSLARDYHLDPASCVAWGRSLGSSVACWLALHRKLGGLILTCPFDSIEAVASTMYPGWLVRALLPDLHRTTDFAGDITAHTLILAAQNDEIIPFERTKTLYESLTCTKALVKIDGAGHNTISQGPGYYEYIGKHIEKFITDKMGELGSGKPET